MWKKKRSRKPKLKRNYWQEGCSICDFKVWGRVRSHVEETHLPWYARPNLCCWTCWTYLSYVATLKRNHGPDQPGHTEDSLLTDSNIVRWARLMAGLLAFLREQLDMRGCCDLASLVRQEGWCPPETPQGPPPSNI